MPSLICQYFPYYISQVLKYFQRGKCLSILAPLTVLVCLHFHYTRGPTSYVASPAFYAVIGWKKSEEGMEWREKL